MFNLITKLTFNKVLFGLKLLYRVVKMSLDVNISEPDEFNCNELHRCIEKVAEIKNIENIIYHVDYLCGKNENYIANIFRVNIKDSENDKQCNVIIKTLINTERHDLFHHLHEREIQAYRILNKFTEIQESMPIEERIVFPELISAENTKSKEVIVLQDMKDLHFEMDDSLSKHEKLSLAKVITVVKGLAKFHALTFIYEKQESEFDEMKRDFCDVMFSESLNKRLISYFLESYEMSVNLVEDLEVKQKLVQIGAKVLELLRDYSQPGKVNVLCHGDCWLNNVLFRDLGTQPQLCLLDFQTLRYTSPLTDVYHLLYLCTDSSFRSAHLEDIINQYYDTLKSTLITYGIDVNLVYNKEDFGNDVIEYKGFGLLTALINLKIVTEVSEDERIAEAKVSKEDIEETGSKLLLKHMVNDVVDECKTNGVIDKLVDKVKTIDGQ